MSFVERLKESQLKFNVIDIETKPMISYHWGLFKQFISLDQIIDGGGLLSFASKTIGNDSVDFFSEWELGQRGLVEAAYNLINDTDVLITYNGDRFDIKKLNAYFIQQGFPKPKPFKSIDLYKENRRHFSWPSGKLDYLAGQVVDDHKVQHSGITLWIDVMNGDKDAQKLFKEYNIQDVLLTEKIYLEHLSWWSNVPNMNLFLETAENCPKCGSDKIQLLEASEVHTAVQSYHLYQCQECLSYSRGNNKLGVTVERKKIV